ncbi:hypothetical protein ANN_02857 [Periplaneta americana]|uniref:Uncharacterized protein n=1 Tax=Periplaneta americana TaxID=6978 RepID=A0ABQ8U218_PERAM|nr:hypothetical protein ANN_02857 [Periplaneta americana]
MAGLCEGGNEPPGSLNAIIQSVSKPEQASQPEFDSSVRPQLVSSRRPEFECSGPQLEGPEFECSGPQLEGPSTSPEPKPDGNRVRAVNSISTDMITTDNTSTSPCCGRLGARIWLFWGLFIGFSALIASIWIMIEYHRVEVDEFQALYGAETWTLRRSEEKGIEAFEMWIWRRMERVKWTDRIRNEAVTERTKYSLGDKLMTKVKFISMNLKLTTLDFIKALVFLNRREAKNPDYTRDSEWFLM